MTKEELKNEAKSYAKRKFNEEEQAYLHDVIAQAYYDGAKPREKQITIDAERIVTLQKTNGSLTDKVNAIEAQIEKMKCCGNCENRYGQEKCADCHNYSKWKFKQAEQFYEETVE